MNELTDLFLILTGLALVFVALALVVFFWEEKQ